MSDLVNAAHNVSTGALPAPQIVNSLLEQAYNAYKHDQQGLLSNVYPAMQLVDPNLFGICLAGIDGTLYEQGDDAVDFTIMSISKPFVFALICETLGPEEARTKLGVNSTGKAFNALSALEINPDGRTNPMVNPGAIAAASFAPGQTEAEQWEFIYNGLCGFAGHKLEMDQEILDSARATNYRNRALANAMYGMGLLGSSPESAVENYTKQCSLKVCARDLAIMGATLADGGVNPVSRRRVVGNPVCHYTLAVMLTAGLYETSGDWLYDVGLPGKSGIGGGIVTIAPGKGGLATFAPLLDSAGNSVKGQLAARSLSRGIGLDLLLSEPYYTLPEADPRS